MKLLRYKTSGKTFFATDVVLMWGEGKYTHKNLMEDFISYTKQDMYK